jgi:carboxymethylenebutenolidase
MSLQEITLDVPGYRVDAGPAAPRLLVLPEIYGVNDEVRRVADFYGGQGFTTFAPDLFHRLQPGLVFAYTDREAARGAVAQLAAEQLVDDIRAAERALRAGAAAPRKTAILAFGWGGQFGLAAARDATFGAVATYYAGNLAPHIATALEVHAPLLFHFSAIDPRTPPELRASLRRALADRDDVEIYTHEGVDHGFANHGRPEYDRGAAERAERQTLHFLRRPDAH